MKKFLVGFSVFLIILTIIPFIDSSKGWVRIWSFPRLQLSVLMIGTLIGWAFYRKEIKKYIVIVVLLLAGAIHQVSKFIPYTFIYKPEVVNTKQPAKDREISILFYNVYMYNKRTDDFINLANSADADIILLAESDKFWSDKMKPLHEKYPYKSEVPLGNTYGMCLYSRLPLSSTEVKYLVEPDIPSIHTIVTLKNGQQVRLYCIHPEPPNLKKSTKDRDAELVIVAKEIENRNLPVLVAGDLNDVAWSSTTNLFGEISKCNDPRVGRGLYNTFNAKYPLFRWPLDHFFCSDEFTLNNIKKYDYIGSDHFPIFISLTYEPSSASENKKQEADKSDRKESDEKLRKEKEEEVKKP